MPQRLSSLIAQLDSLDHPADIAARITELMRKHGPNRTPDAKHLLTIPYCDACPGKPGWPCDLFVAFAIMGRLLQVEADEPTHHLPVPKPVRRAEPVNTDGY